MASCTKVAGPEKGSSSSERVYRHPIAQRREGEPEKRRQAFLRKVREAGDDKKWQTRSDQILRKDFMSQQKQWREELAQSAPAEPVAPEEEEREALPDIDEKQEVEMVDDVLTQEDREFEALISLMNKEEKVRDGQEHDLSDYGSDEEDYDVLFLEALAEADARRHTLAAPKDRLDLGLDYKMDESMG